MAALVNDRWWVLRINAFPDHALWTLFVDGVPRFDIDQAPSTWGRPLEPWPMLESVIAEEVLAPVENFVAYGSEAGQPCDDPFCCG
ncbi:hypothetical protein [Nocardia tenerifensis]|uniref:hypothetical protein n=1 Tax=Nocardia tenerifensis TaxID=228006 RepID=UPI00030A82A2|nr:hypothetical protein [Nocardia tenerifensis]